MTYFFAFLAAWALYGVFRYGYRAAVWKKKGSATNAWWSAGAFLACTILSITFQ